MVDLGTSGMNRYDRNLKRSKDQRKKYHTQQEKQLSNSNFSNYIFAVKIFVYVGRLISLP